MGEEQEKLALNSTVAISDAGPCRKKVSIEIPEDTIKKATDHQYETLRKNAIVPGFRPGRAPRKLLEKRFGKDAGEQIKLKLVAQASDEALKDNKVDYLRDPDIDIEKIALPTGGPLKFDFEVEVKPQFDLPKLDSIEVTKTKFEVSEQQVAKEIEMLRKWSGMWTPRDDGTVQTDDLVYADVIIKTEGTEESQKLDNIEIYVRPNGFVAAVPVEKLDEILVGAKTGQQKKMSVNVPKTYFKEDLRGKSVDIEITIKDVKWLKPADINDDFLKKFAVKDAAELEKNVSENLKFRAEQKSTQEMAEQIYKYLLEKTAFDLPDDVVAEQSNSILQRQYLNLLRQGLTKEQIDLQMDQLKAASEKQAKEQLKTFFIMDKVADKLAIKVTDEQVNGYIAQLALQRGQRPERLKETMARDGSLAQLGLQLRDDKCIEKILETARITEVEPPKVKEEKPAAGRHPRPTKKTQTKPAPEEKPQKPKKKNPTAAAKAKKKNA